MKLYHATKLENIDNILENGIVAMQSEKESRDTRLSGSFVYGFDNIEDAVDFMVYDNNCSDYAVVSFEAVSTVVDPEYDDGAFAVESDVAADRLTLEDV